jgi:enhancing lycopene biosynthesis protein 2
MTNKKKIAVILSGCGVYDGAEIHETVFTMWAIAESGAEYQLYAPDKEQHHVINHLDGTEMKERRNVLTEAARIARGNISPLTSLKPEHADALVFPGGFGVAKNLCSFAFDGAECKVDPEVESVVKSFHKAGKPIGVLCIAPVLIARLIKSVEVTIGSDPGPSAAIDKMGGKHIVTTHGEVVVDTKHRIVSTPCYMLDANILQIADGAKKLVGEVLKLC